MTSVTSDINGSALARRHQIACEDLGCEAADDRHHVGERLDALDAERRSAGRPASDARRPRAARGPTAAGAGSARGSMRRVSCRCRLPAEYTATMRARSLIGTRSTAAGSFLDPLFDARMEHREQLRLLFLGVVGHRPDVAHARRAAHAWQSARPRRPRRSPCQASTGAARSSERRAARRRRGRTLPAARPQSPSGPAE